MFVLAEAGQEGAAGLFEGDGNFAVGEASPEGVSPVRQGFRGLFQSGALDGGAAGGRETEGVFLVTPVQADAGSIVRLGAVAVVFCSFIIMVVCIRVAGALAWTQRRPYSETFLLSASEYSF